MSELLAAALLDMHWHSVREDKLPDDVDAFEAASLRAENMDLAAVPPRYRSSYFSHIFGRRLRRGLLRLSVDADAGG